MKQSSIVPPTRLLVSGQQESRTRIFARRPGGTTDWLLVYTAAGQGYFRFPGGEFIARANDLVLVRPGAPHDYGVDERDRRYWKNTWTHFIPRPDCLDWLRWPEFAPGMMHLHLDLHMGRQVRCALTAMHAATHTAHRRAGELAVNMLERALLLCDSVNPCHVERQQDSRVRKAMEFLCAHPEQPITLESLARICGLSRSRLSELFLQQIGITPFAFLESRRLKRASELLAHTSLALTDIAGQCGFSDSFYLSLRFKKHFGKSPRQFRAFVRPK